MRFSELRLPKISLVPMNKVITEDMQFVFKRLDRNKDGKLDADDILRGAALYNVVLE